jgi:protein-S-isoprenylcysteine O-methyltransferase Ste14
MRLALLIVALAVVVSVWRSRRGVEVWHVAVDQSAGHVQGP